MNVTDIITPTQLADLNVSTNGMGQAEAKEITVRLRTWVKAYPAGDIARAYQGRIWVPMGYESWSEYCDCELDGFKLPSRVERPAVVEKLSGAGLSNRAIADAIGVSRETVNRAQRPGGTNVSPDHKVQGKDGKTYSRHRPTLPDIAEGIDASTVSRDISSLSNVRDDPPPPVASKDGRVRDTSNIGKKPLPSNMPESFDCKGTGDDGYEALLGTVKRTLNGLSVSPTIEQVDATLQLLDRYTRKFSKIKETLQ